MVHFAVGALGGGWTGAEFGNPGIEGYHEDEVPGRVVDPYGPIEERVRTILGPDQLPQQLRYPTIHEAGPVRSIEALPEEVLAMLRSYLETHEPPRSIGDPLEPPRASV